MCPTPGRDTGTKKTTQFRYLPVDKDSVQSFIFRFFVCISGVNVKLKLAEKIKNHERRENSGPGKVTE